MATRLYDRRSAHPDRAVKPVVGVAADQRIDSGNFCGELGVLSESEVRQHHDQVDVIFVAQSFDMARQLGLAERKTHSIGVA